MDGTNPSHESSTPSSGDGGSPSTRCLSEPGIAPNNPFTNPEDRALKFREKNAADKSKCVPIKPITRPSELERGNNLRSHDHGENTPIVIRGQQPHPANAEVPLRKSRIPRRRQDGPVNTRPILSSGITDFIGAKTDKSSPRIVFGTALWSKRKVSNVAKQTAHPTLLSAVSSQRGESTIREHSSSNNPQQVGRKHLLNNRQHKEERHKYQAICWMHGCLCCHHNIMTASAVDASQSQWQKNLYKHSKQQQQQRQQPQKHKQLHMQSPESHQYPNKKLFASMGQQKFFDCSIFGNRNKTNNGIGEVMDLSENSGSSSICSHPLATSSHFDRNGLDGAGDLKVSLGILKNASDFAVKSGLLTKCKSSHCVTNSQMTSSKSISRIPRLVKSTMTVVTSGQHAEKCSETKEICNVCCTPNCPPQTKKIASFSQSTNIGHGTDDRETDNSSSENTCSADFNDNVTWLSDLWPVQPMAKNEPIVAIVRILDWAPISSLNQTAPDEQIATFIDVKTETHDPLANSFMSDILFDQTETQLTDNLTGQLNTSVLPDTPFQSNEQCMRDSRGQRKTCGTSARLANHNASETSVIFNASQIADTSFTQPVESNIQLSPYHTETQQNIAYQDIRKTFDKSRMIKYLPILLPLPTEIPRIAQNDVDVGEWLNAQKVLDAEIAESCIGRRSHSDTRIGSSLHQKKWKTNLLSSSSSSYEDLTSVFTCIDDHRQNGKGQICCAESKVHEPQANRRFSWMDKFRYKRAKLFGSPSKSGATNCNHPALTSNSPTTYNKTFEMATYNHENCTPEIPKQQWDTVICANTDLGYPTLADSRWDVTMNKSFCSACASTARCCTAALYAQLPPTSNSDCPGADKDLYALRVDLACAALTAFLHTRAASVQFIYVPDLNTKLRELSEQVLDDISNIRLTGDFNARSCSAKGDIAKERFSEDGEDTRRVEPRFSERGSKADKVVGGILVVNASTAEYFRHPDIILLRSLEAVLDVPPSSLHVLVDRRSDEYENYRDDS